MEEEVEKEKSVEDEQELFTESPVKLELRKSAELPTVENVA